MSASSRYRSPAGASASVGEPDRSARSMASQSVVARAIPPSGDGTRGRHRSWSGNAQARSAGGHWSRRPGAIAAGQEGLHTETMISLGDYPRRGDPDGSSTMANYGGIRFMTTKDRWIAINPAVAATLDWSPDPQRVGAWHGSDGERRVATVVWAEGYVGW